MAQPRRRRNNKHNRSFIKVVNPKTHNVELIPRSRLAFRAEMKAEIAVAKYDLIIIQRLMYGVKAGEVKFIKARVKGDYELLNPELSGYYGRNSKGVIKLTEDLIKKYKDLMKAEKTATKLLNTHSGSK
jgi:hypothetical protein